MTRKCLLAVLVLATISANVEAGQPRFGVDGEFIDSPFGSGLRAYRIDEVYWRSVASAAGLEPGDIIAYIDTYGFRSEAAFDWIMGQVGQTAQVGIINVRTGKLEWISCRFNHQPHRNERRPPGVVSVNFGFVGVVTIYNHTANNIHFQIRVKREGADDWGAWRSYTHRFPNGGYQWLSFRQAGKIQIRFDYVGGDGRITWKTYDLSFQEHAGNAALDRWSGTPYHFRFTGDFLGLYTGTGW